MKAEHYGVLLVRRDQSQVSCEYRQILPFKSKQIKYVHPYFHVATLQLSLYFLKYNFHIEIG